jgi:hypothetical protein
MVGDEGAKSSSPIEGNLHWNLGILLIISTFIRDKN